MFKNKNLVRRAANKIAAAGRMALQDLEHGRALQEPPVTDRLIAYIQYKLNDKSISGVQWHALTLPDRGPNSAESQLGADLLSVVQFDLPDFKVAKGFLAQAKLVEPSSGFTSQDSHKLKDQCEKMLAVSPASFVFLYSLQSGILVVPAIEVLAARSCNPHELTSYTLARFFTEHFECFIGDRKFAQASRHQLDVLREEYRARRVLLIEARAELPG
jgi:hypothetical protein